MIHSYRSAAAWKRKTDRFIHVCESFLIKFTRTLTDSYMYVRLRGGVDHSTNILFWTSTKTGWKLWTPIQIYMIKTWSNCSKINRHSNLLFKLSDGWHLANAAGELGKAKLWQAILTQIPEIAFLVFDWRVCSCHFHQFYNINFKTITQFPPNFNISCSHKFTYFLINFRPILSVCWARNLYPIVHRSSFILFLDS